MGMGKNLKALGLPNQWKDQSVEHVLQATLLKQGQVNDQARPLIIESCNFNTDALSHTIW